MSTNQKKVSIVCCTYNQCQYIRDALDGFLMQKTDFEFEVLVHDDASTDGTADIIREYEQKYPNIIKPIYQNDNQYSQGISIKKEFIIPRVSGKYIALCEGDDFWTDPLKLQKQVDFLEAHPEYTLCATACVWRNMRDNVDEDQFIISEDMDVSVEDIIVEKNGRIFPTVSVLVRKEIYTVIPNWMKVFTIGDTPLFIYAGINGRIRMLADITCVYRWYAKGSWTVSMNNTEKNLYFKQRSVLGFEQLNVETNYKYSECISETLHKIKFDMAVLQKDWTNIVSKEYRDVWNNLSFKSKLSIFLQCKMPKTYRLSMRLLHGGQ